MLTARGCPQNRLDQSALIDLMLWRDDLFDPLIEIMGGKDLNESERMKRTHIDTFPKLGGAIVSSEAIENGRFQCSLSTDSTSSDPAPPFPQISVSRVVANYQELQKVVLCSPGARGP